MTKRARKRTAVLCAAITFVVIAALGGSALRGVQRERLLARSLAQGLAAHKGKDYPLALTRLAYYVGRRPGDGPAILVLADSRWKTPTENGKHLVLASRYALAAADAMPGDPAPLEMLLALYGEMNYLSERVEIADRLLRINERHGPALRARAESFLLQGAKDKALSAAVAWSDKVPDDANAHRARIAAMRLAGSPAHDIGAYADRAVAHRPDDIRFIVFQAEVHLLVLNDRAAAAAAIHRALQAEPSDSSSLSLLLRLLDNYGLEQDDPSLAGQAERLLSGVPKDPALAADIAAIAAKRDFKLGKAPDAAARFADMAAAPGRVSDPALGIAAFLLGLEPPHSPPAPILGVLRVRDTPVSTAWLTCLDGLALLQGSDAPGARRKFAGAAAADPSNDMARYFAAQADLQVGEWRRAASILNDLASDDPSWAIARLSLVSVLLSRNQLGDALTQARAAFAAHPRLAEGLRLCEAAVGVAEMTREDTDAKEAERLLTSLAGADPGEPTVLALRARLDLHTGRIDSARHAAEQLFQVRSIPTADPLVSLAAAFRAVDPGLSNRLLERASAIEPDNPDVVYAMAVNTASTDPERAERMLSERISSRPPHSADRLAYQKRLAIFLEQRKDPRSPALLRQVAAENPGDPAPQSLLLDAASSWSDESQVAPAIERYRALCGDDSSQWRTYEARRLLAFVASGDRASRAVQLLVPVVASEPRNAPALALLAEANRVLGDAGKSIEYLSRAVDAEPNNPAYYPPLISGLERASRHPDAARRLSEFAKIADLAPELRRRRAQLLAAQSQWSAAASDYEQFAGSEDAADRAAYADALAHAGRIEQAGAVFADLLNAPSPSAAVILAAAEFAASQGEVDRGGTLLDRLPPAMPASERLAIRATYFERHLRPQAAAKLYLEAASGGDPDRAADLALCLLRQGKAQDAANTTTAALQRAPGHRRLAALANISKIKLGGSVASGSLATTLGALVTDADPVATEQWLHAVLFLDAQPPDRARYIDETTALTRSFPTFYPAWHGLVLARLEDRDASAATDAARKALDAMPADPRAARLASLALSLCGKLDEAVDAAAAWSRLTRADPYEADNEIARLQLLRHRPADGLAALARWSDRIIAEADHSPEKLENYAAILAQTGADPQARALLWERALGSPAWASSYLRVARTCENDPDLQRRWYADAQRLAKDAPATLLLASSWYDLALHSKSPDDHARVIAALSQLQTQDNPPPLAHDAFMLRASSHEARGEIEQAARMYRGAIRLSPGDAIALNNLAFLLFRSGGPTEEALDLARRSVAEADRKRLPELSRASSLDTLGCILCKMNRTDEAREAFEHALKLSPGLIDLWVGLAEAQVQGNRLADARASMDRIESFIRKGGPAEGPVADRIDRLRARIHTESRKTAPG